MDRSRKSRRVSWARGSDFCQVRYYLPDDRPSEIGHRSQGHHHHLEAKPSSSVLCSSTDESDDDSLIPPGFESIHFSRIPQIKWKRPPQISISSRWRVAAGEESEEKDTQKLREMRELEAHYPRYSDIPQSSFVSLDVEAEDDYDDLATPLVPLIPIEEREFEEEMQLIAIEERDEEDMQISPDRDTVNAPSNIVQPQNLQECLSLATTGPLISSGCNSVSSTGTVSLDARIMPLLSSGALSPGFQGNTAAAALVAAMLIKSTEHGKLIDLDLLIKIFNDPKLIEALSNLYRMASTNTSSSSSNTSTIATASGLKPAFQPEPLSNVGETGGAQAQCANSEDPLMSRNTTVKNPAFCCTTTPTLSTPSPGVVATASSVTPPLPSVAASSLPCAALKPVKTASFSVLNPASGNLETQFVAAVSSFSMMTSTNCKPEATASSVLLSWPIVPGKQVPPPLVSPPPLTLPPPPPFPMPIASNTLPPPPPRPNIIPEPGVKQATPFPSSINSTVPLSPATQSLNTMVNQAAQTTATTATTMPNYQLNISGSGSGSTKVVKDFNFYRDLVREDGPTKQGKQEYSSQSGKRHHRSDCSSSSRDLKPAARDITQGDEVNQRKIHSRRITCLYFNSPKGCRHGHKCHFLHDFSVKGEARNNDRGSKNNEKRSRLR